MSVLITGAAGFIGYRTAKLFLERGFSVIGIDNMNEYYDPSLKRYRISELQDYENFTFRLCDIENRDELESIFGVFDISTVINLAARAGVRYSIKDPYIYFSTNVTGTLNLLELCKKYNINKFVLASTSSIYAGHRMPFTEDLDVNRPISPYAASKKAAEVLCYTYHYLYGIDIFVLRYFTVYGPSGRPDMSVFKFIRNILLDQPIEIYGDGTQSRDFTYVDDIAEGTYLAAEKVKGFEIINLGGNKPHKLMDLVNIIEDLTGRKAKINFSPAHKTDMKATWASIEKAERILGWFPKIPLREGLGRTVSWFIKNIDFIKTLKINE